MFKYFLIFILTITPCYSLEVKYLTQDSKAPFTGYLISPDAEKYFRELNQNEEAQLKLITTYKTIIQMHEGQQALSEQRIMKLQEQNNTLIEQQVKLDGTFTKIAMFLLGATLTTAITYGVYQTRD